MGHLLLTLACFTVGSPAVPVSTAYSLLDTAFAKLRAMTALGEAGRGVRFGPVSTLLPYGGLDEAADIAARGGGSLAGSIVTADDQVARTLITALAPWHGRLLVLDRHDAAGSTGHGVAMPQLVHGGPGRAGGGEELGGLRALRPYLRRTAVQAHPRLLEGPA